MIAIDKCKLRLAIESHKMPENLKLNVNQAMAVQLIAQGMRRNAIASQLSIDPGTLSRWRRIPIFQEELDKLLAQMERDCIDSFRAVKSIAIERLAALLNSPNQAIALKAIELVISKTELNKEKLPVASSYGARETAHWNGILDELLGK